MSIVPSGSVIYGMQLPIQSLSKTFVEDWENDASVADLVRVVQACEQAGFSFVGVCDHIALPYNDYTQRMMPTWYDPISTLAFLGGKTSSIRLLTDVYIAAYRHPLLSAKQFMTMDHLTGGRVIVGVGAGHVESEFEALGIDFHTRGKRTDEALDAMRAAFDAEYSSFSGEFFDYGEVGLAPRPDQAHIPVWVGGGSKAALRRVAERGDGWIPFGTPRAIMQETLDYIRSHRDKVRPGTELDLGFMPESIYVGTPSWDIGEGRLSGSAEQIAESLRFGPKLGANVLHLRFRSRSADELCDQVTAFGAEVAPHLTS